MLYSTILILTVVMLGPKIDHKDRQLLQRVQVIDNQLYSVDHNIADSSMDVKSVNIRLSQKHTNLVTKQFDISKTLVFKLYHHDSAVQPIASKLNLPWTIHNDKWYISTNATPGPPASAWLMNISLTEKEPRKSQPLYDNGNINLMPVERALSGFWVNDDGQSILLRSIPHIDFDLYFTHDDVFHLFVTVDSGLTYWTYENKEWKYVRKYDFKVDGPFFITDNGNSIVVQRDGKWCVISNIETNEPTIERIAPVLKNIPLILIEDMTAKKQYLDLDGRVFDMKGIELDRFPTHEKFNDRAEKLFDFIIKQRE